MRFISHRGNINGKIVDKENSPDYIKDALSKGYDVEIDLWCYNNRFILGHDIPQYEIDFSFLCDVRLWIHVKNKNALQILMDKKLKGFWHSTNEDYVLTTSGHIWVYPGKELLYNSIVVLPELTNYTKNDFRKCYAICSDFIEKYNNGGV